MKNLKFLLFSLLFLVTAGANAQSVKIKWKQIQSGTQGQVAIVGVDGSGAWVTPPFLNISDTGSMLAIYQTQINARVKYTDTAAMLSAYQTALNGKVKYTDTAAMLSAYQAAIALKANDNSVMHLFNNETAGGIKTFNQSPLVPLPTTNDQAANKLYVDGAIYDLGSIYILQSQIGVPNGIPPLDPGGKIDFQYLPATLMIYKGVWNGATNTPTLANGVGTTGWVYKATPGGTVNFGAGNITFAAGDWVIYNGTQWERSNNSDLVVSVNGMQGIVSLTTTNIPEGTNLYYRDTLARAALSAGAGISYNPLTGVITNSAPNGPSNLALGTVTNTTQPITNSNGTGVTLPAATTSAAGLLTGTDKTKLDGIATGATANTGTVTSVAMTVPTGLSITGTPITTSGTLALSLTAGYSIPTTANQTNWTAGYNDKINSAAVTGTTTKTLTLNQQDGGTVTANWTDLQSQYTAVAQQFTGSTSMSISLSNTPSISAHLTVYMNGVALHASDYSVSGTTLTLANLTRESSDYFLVYYSY